MLKSSFHKIRYIKYYKYFALFFSFLSDIIYEVLENNRITFKKWNYKLSPKLGFDNDLSLICKKICNQFEEDLKKKSKNKFSGEHYTVNLTENLNKDIFLEIERHFLKNYYIERARQYLCFKPKISLINIYANLPGNPAEKNIGSKAYHRDSNCYRLYEIFFAVTNVNDKNGPFFFIENLELQNRCETLHSSNMKYGEWASDGRIKESELKKINSNKIRYGKFIGKPGSTVELNTGVTFHKGGYVKEGYRIVGRVVYSGIEYKHDERISGLKKVLIKLHNIIEYNLGRYFIRI